MSWSHIVAVCHAVRLLLRGLVAQCITSVAHTLPFCSNVALGDSMAAVMKNVVGFLLLFQRTILQAFAEEDCPYHAWRQEATIKCPNAVTTMTSKVYTEISTIPDGSATWSGIVTNTRPLYTEQNPTTSTKAGPRVPNSLAHTSMTASLPKIPQSPTTS